MAVFLAYILHPGFNVAMRIEFQERKSNILTPSRLPCLSQICTVNMTKGCMHGCVYCYARGYSEYPGDERVVIYSNTVEKITSELLRKRKKPISIYFSPSSDAFQAIPEVLEITFETMKKILSFGIGVEFLTE